MLKIILVFKFSTFNTFVLIQSSLNGKTDIQQRIMNNIRGGSRAVSTYKMECFVIIANALKLLPIITKHSILDVAAALVPPLTIWQYPKHIFLLQKLPALKMLLLRSLRYCPRFFRLILLKIYGILPHYVFGYLCCIQVRRKSTP